MIESLLHRPLIARGALAAALIFGMQGDTTTHKEIQTSLYRYGLVQKGGVVLQCAADSQGEPQIFHSPKEVLDALHADMLLESGDYYDHTGNAFYVSCASELPNVDTAGVGDIVSIPLSGALNWEPVRLDD